VGHKIDLEGLAHHRGSTFGQYIQSPQPSIATFENRLALSISGKSLRRFLVEDESRGIGKITIPQRFLSAMHTAPLVVLTAAVEERVRRIHREYIEIPAKLTPLNEIRDYAKAGVVRISKKLGGVLASDLLTKIDFAFNCDGDSFTEHSKWISMLLEKYYDKNYTHSLLRHDRRIEFKGNYKECFAWISDQFV
jgi:tRNA 2-selenouridine synthase